VSQGRPVRLQKFLAEAGLGSRRRCEELIEAGRVHVQGEIAVLGMTIDPDRDPVTVDGLPVVTEEKEYWLLNKPAGILSAASDARGRKIVVDCVPARGRVFPVGRLDLDSTGLMVLTNDGDLANRLLHPRHHVEKEYVVVVRGLVTEETARKLRSGVDLDDGPTAPAQVTVISRSQPRSSRLQTTLTVVLHEGRKRQVRRMFEAVGHRVVSLHRRRFDGLTDEGLALGEARPLSTTEIERLRRAAR